MPASPARRGLPECHACVNHASGSNYVWEWPALPARGWLLDGAQMPCVPGPCERLYSRVRSGLLCQRAAGGWWLSGSETVPRAQVRLGEKEALDSTLRWFEARADRIGSLEFYQVPPHLRARRALR